MISLLPPFINASYALPTQLRVLVMVVLASEFIYILLYALGGKTIGSVLTQRDNTSLLNKISGCLMWAIAIWLVLD